MKKLLSLCLILALVLCLAACGSEEPAHNHTHHLHGALTQEQAAAFKSGTLRIFARLPDGSYTPLAQQGADFHDGTLCANWTEKFISGPDGTAVTFHPISGSLEEYYIDGILWDYDTMTSVACTWHISLATGQIKVVNCYESAAWGTALDWAAYDQTNYKYFTYSPQWDESGPMLPLEKWSQQGFIGASEDDLSDGVDLKITSMNKDVEYFYCFEVELTDGTVFATELTALVHE